MATLHADGDATVALVKGRRAHPGDVHRAAGPRRPHAAAGRRALDAGGRSTGSRRLRCWRWRGAPPAGKQDLDHADIDGELTLLGLVGIIDPPRPEAIEAVAQCRAAGIRVVMITGDHGVTASAIAAQLGLGDALQAITGPEIEALDDAALQQAVHTTRVFARASPEHKLRLVRALQAGGEIVAMTGDGVNDAPALKQADVGVAMGMKAPKPPAGRHRARRRQLRPLRMRWRKGAPSTTTCARR